MMTNEELVEQIQAGKNVQENMGVLYEQNKRLIHKFTLPFSNVFDVDDLMQEAYFGLVKAVEGFDAEKKFRFMTYAEYKIKGHLQRYVLNHGHGKRIPVRLLHIISKYFAVIQAYQNENDDFPPDEYIMSQIGVNKNALLKLKKVIQEMNSVSTSELLNETDLTIEESIADETDYAEDVIQKLDEEIIKSEIWETVGELEPKYKNIITMLYKNNSSLAELADKYGVSAERIRQCKKRAFRLLKQKEKIQRAAEFYGYDNSLIYHGGYSFFKNTGMSSVEYAVIERIGIEEKANKVDKLLCNMDWSI